MARLYLDEDLANFVSRLRDSGHDVQFAGDVGAARSDPWHLQRASSEGRLLITFNERDYRYLHRLWNSVRAFQVTSTQHGGILTATAQLAADAWLPAIDELLTTERELAGRLLAWHASLQKWREDRWRPED